MARSPLSPTPCALCGVLRRGSRWQSGLSKSAAEAPPAKTETAPIDLEWLKALRCNPIPETSLRSPGNSQIRDKYSQARDKSRRRRRRPPKNKPLLRPIMPYPTYRGKRQNLRSVHRSLTAQMIQEDFIGKSRNGPIPAWAATLQTLKKRTPKRATPWKRHALKIVVPDEGVKPLMDHVDGNIWDITDRTTCAIELYRGVEGAGFSTLLLSGDDIAIQEATDIIMGKCERARIFRPNQANPEAPLLQGSPSAAKEFCVESNLSSWPSHLSRLRGRPQFWNRRFDEIPKPATWTKWSFFEYIKTLTKAKLRPHRAIELYGSVHAADEALMGLIYNAFAGRIEGRVLSVSALRLALERMEEAGFKFRPHARRLFSQAQACRLHVDTNVFNKFLLGCVKTRDLRNFNRILDLMDSHTCTPNYETWMLFLKMIHDEGMKRRIVLEMDEIGLLHNPRATRDVVQEIAQFDTYRAMDSGKGAISLCREFDVSYGPTWPSRGALNNMLVVCRRFERFDMGLELIKYFEREYQIVSNISTFATLLTSVDDFDTALKALRYMESRLNLKKTEQIYRILHTAAWRKKLMNVMAVVFTYACVEDATSFPMRYRVSRQLARPGYKMRPKFHRGTNLEPASFFAMPGYVPIDLWADLYGELVRDPAQEEHQGAVLAALYRSQLGGYLPTVPLADMIEKALALDERLHALKEGVSKKQGSHVVSIRAELGGNEFFEIPLRHSKGLEEDRVLKVPIASEGIVNNYEQEWYKDAKRHPRMDIVPWEVMLDGEVQRGEPEDAENISEEWLAFEKGVTIGGRKEAASDELVPEQEEAALEEGRATLEKTSQGEGAASGAEKPAEGLLVSEGGVLEEERVLEEEALLEGKGSFEGEVGGGQGDAGFREEDSRREKFPEPTTPADGDLYAEKPIPNPLEAEEPVPSSFAEDSSPDPVSSTAEEESSDQTASTSVERNHHEICGADSSAHVPADDSSPTPAEDRKKTGERRREMT